MYNEKKSTWPTESRTDQDQPRSFREYITLPLIVFIAGLFYFFIPIIMFLTRVEWNLMTFHPLFMSLFIVLSSTGIAAMQASTSPRPPRSKGFLAHRIIMSLALLCLICGAVAIVTNKIRIGMRHFYTPHGRLGLTSLILLLIQGSFGIFVTIIPGYKVLYKYHRAVGYIAIFMAWLTACLGLEFRSYSPLLFWAYYAWVAMPVVLVTLYWRMNIRKIFRKPDPIHT